VGGTFILYDFGTVQIGTSSSATFNIQNTGKEVLTIHSITIPPGFASTFLPSSIEPGESAIFSFSFTPTVETQYTGTLKINSNDADESPYKFTVSCT